MTTAANRFEAQVRCPQLLFDQQKRGEITAPMFLAMVWLYSWAGWKTGIVQHASAGGLHIATFGAFSVRTYQAAMNRLEKMGWITRHIVHGSRTDFPITLHNYKWVDEEGKTHILNPKPLVAAVEKRPHRRVNKGTSKHSASEGCGRKQTETTDPQPENADAQRAAVRAAVEVTLRKAVEDDEKPNTYHGQENDDCGRGRDEAATRSCLRTSLNTCNPSQSAGFASASPDQNQQQPVAERRISQASLRVPIPEDFQPDAINKRYAKKNGLDLEEELAAFSDLHGSIGNERKNWQAVFRKHLVNVAPLNGHIKLPDWVPEKEWKAYLAMRERIRKGATQAAQTIGVRILGELRDQGQNVAAVLNQSTHNEWTGLFEVGTGPRGKRVPRVTTGSLTANYKDMMEKCEAMSKAAIAEEAARKASNANVSASGQPV